MRVYQTADYAAMSRRAANIISAHVIVNPGCVLGLATGSSPIGAYRQLIDWYQKGDLDFAGVRSVNLDEYRGLSPHHAQSYRCFMQENLFNHINIKPENTNVPDGLAPDAQAECRRYNEVIGTVGGIDLQLLGMGHNGHIGFNEPGDAFELETHLVTLAQSTLEANARFFENDITKVPTQAYTLGTKCIMQARRILVVVSGEDKAAIVKTAFLGPVTPEVPASILQLHPDVTIVGDGPALHQYLEAGGTLCG